MSRCLNEPDAETLLVLLRDAKGTPLATYRNLEIIFRTDPAYRDGFRWDAFTHRALFREVPMGSTTDTQILMDIARRYDIEFSPEAVRRMTTLQAQQKPSHAVKDYLRSLVWDGKSRLADLMRKGFGCGLEPQQTDIQLWDIGQKFCLSLVARILNPQARNDSVVVLQGAQGVRKSAAFEALVPNPEWYTNAPLRGIERDPVLAIQGKWIYEISEIQSYKKNEQESLKRFISRRYDAYRAPFTSEVREVYRNTTFVATTSEDSFEDTCPGDRIYVRVTTRETHPVWIRENRDQLWAEAVVLYDRNVSWEDMGVLPEDCLGVSDEWASILLAYIRSGTQDGFFSVERILTQWLNIPEEKISRVERTRIVDLMRSLGVPQARLQQMKVALEYGYTSTPRGYWIHEETRKRLAV